MIAPYWAALIATATVAIGEFCNRRVIGWLPEDPPRPGRKLHLRPMPLAGALIVPTILAWCIADRAWLPLAAIVVATATGFEDDRRKEHSGPIDEAGVDWRIKAVGLAIAAGLIAATVADPLVEPWFFAMAFGLTFVLTNAVNFLDNMDGVATSLAATMLLSVGLGKPTAAWIAAAGFAAAGFLPWNWPRPRLFLGDGGAYALGLCASYAIVHTAREEPLFLLVAAVPLVDFLQVVCARIWLAVPPWVGDRRHVTHIAHNLGVKKVLVAPFVAAITALLGVVALRGGWPFVN
jgi:UDP-N-acetylmuramyl pentapeptide phosphotransferase/UDP-N-acetylglucosamine-1-phosphate transferase